jgi:solute carrier family 25, member 34/35
MMNQPVSEAGVGTLYSGPVDCFMKTVKYEGVRGLYKGGLANYMRMAPQYILTFVFFEKFLIMSRNMGWST